jgi:hypothetical protein
MDDIDKREAALLARLEAEREQRLRERIEAGELIEVKLFIVAGSRASALAQVEQAKADKLAELRAAGDQREVKFAVTTVVTGVVQYGEAADPASAPSAPSFSSGEDRPRAVPAARPHLEPDETTSRRHGDDPALKSQDNPEPVIESYVCVQTRQCHDDDDPGEIAEGWFSIDGKVVTVTDARVKYVGSRTMLEGEDARVVAKQLLREKKVPESESFNRRLDYPKSGIA